LWGIAKLKIGIIIPARLESERLPNKVIKPFLGKPMIEHVWRRSQLVNPKIETVIATDSKIIKNVCEEFGAQTLITSSNHINGLSRVGEAARILNWDFYVVLQADEILIEPGSLEKLINTLQFAKTYNFYNLITDLEDVTDLDDANIVKCLVREDSSVITIFRKSSSIATEVKQLEFTKKICGIFAISAKTLQLVVGSPPQKMEISESIEQMKIIEMGIDILGVSIVKSYPSVNTVNDALLVEKILREDELQKAILSSIQ
jgi:3-deoxy-manno-octulosonate cytidylyltransferase (CMP-KDO synthetase)